MTNLEKLYHIFLNKLCSNDPDTTYTLHLDQDQSGYITENDSFLDESVYCSWSNLREAVEKLSALVCLS